MSTNNTSCVTSSSEEMNERFELLEQHSRSYTWEIDTQGQFTYISNGITFLLGYQPENLIGKLHFTDLLTSEYKQFFNQNDLFAQSQNTGFCQWEHQQLHLSGDAVTFVTSISPLMGLDHQIIGYRAVNIDITGQINAQKTLSTTEERLNTIITVSNIGAWEYDSQTSEYWCTHEYFTMLGYDKDRFPQSGRFPGPFQDMLDSLLNAEDLKGAQDRLNKYMTSDSDQFYDSYFRMKKADGNWAWIRSRGKRVRDPNGHLSSRMIGTHIDVTDMKEIEAEILTLSYTDQLTSVYNRRYFEDQMQIIDREDNLPITLFMADVNGLKLINDAFGHAAGDELLVKVSKVLTGIFRSTDTIARIGGDEFVVMMPRTTTEQANNLMARVQSRLTPETVMGIHVSVAIGASTKETISESLIEHFKTAENAMYQVKINNKELTRVQSIQIIIDSLFKTFPAEESHAENVASLATQIGKQLGLETGCLRDLHTLSLFHDIGKVAISKELLSRHSASYNAEEWEEFNRHSEIGYNIISSTNTYASFANDILYHHEHWDGTGYPRSLSGEAIPIKARILAVADAFESLQSNFQHPITIGESYSPDDSIPFSIISQHSGTYFDPLIVNALKKVLRDSTIEEKVN